MRWEDVKVGMLFAYTSNHEHTWTVLKLTDRRCILQRNQNNARVDYTLESNTGLLDDGLYTLIVEDEIQEIDWI